MTQQQVADVLGVSRSVVKKQERIALSKFADAIVELALADERFMDMLQGAFRCTREACDESR
jgi:hypothetical protein